MKNLSFAGALLLPLLMGGCETFAGHTSVQKPPNAVGDGNTEDTFNPRNGAYDQQAPVGVDNSAASGR